jgi:hypothetical protein
MHMGTGALASLPTIRNYRSKRTSSWDETGANKDNWTFEPAQTRTLCDIQGPACIKHI